MVIDNIYVGRKHLSETGRNFGNPGVCFLMMGFGEYSLLWCLMRVKEPKTPRQLECLFSSVSRITQKKIPKLQIDILLWGEFTFDPADSLNSGSVSQTESIQISLCLMRLCLALLILAGIPSNKTKNKVPHPRHLFMLASIYTQMNWYYRISHILSQPILEERRNSKVQIPQQ